MHEDATKETLAAQEQLAFCILAGELYYEIEIVRMWSVCYLQKLFVFHWKNNTFHELLN